NSEARWLEFAVGSVNLNCTVRRTVCESFAIVLRPVAGIGPRPMLERFALRWNRKTACATGVGFGFWSRTPQLPKSETRQRRAERGRRRPARGEHDARGRGRRIARLRPAQIGDPARDRGRGIDEGHRPGREPLQAVEQQRIVRAGEHDGVGAPPISIDKTGRDLLRDQIVGDGRATELGLCEAREPRRLPSLPLAKSRISARVYSRPTVASVPRTATRLVREPAQAGLIAGTVPTNGTLKRVRKCGSTSVEAVLQAMTMRSGRWVSI